MTSSSAARFVISSQGKLRSILSVAEKSNGELILNLRANQRIRATETLINSQSNDPKHGLGIKEYRYTAHISPNSDINTIKLTRINEDGELFTEVQYTLAIKGTNSFAPLYARRCSSLEDKGYDIKNPVKGKNISLGKLVPGFTLVFTVFIGPSNRNFEFTPMNDFRVLQQRFKEFNIVIMFSFLNIPSHESGALLHAVTKKSNNASRGHTEPECVNIFNDFRRNLRGEFINTLGSAPEMSSLMPYLKESTYFHEANIDMFNAHVQMLSSKKII